MFYYFINLDRMYRMAVFQKYKIRNCHVVIEKIVVDKTKTKKLLSSVKQHSVRNHVGWIPTTSAIIENSAVAISGLSDYRKDFANGL